MDSPADGSTDFIHWKVSARTSRTTFADIAVSENAIRLNMEALCKRCNQSLGGLNLCLSGQGMLEVAHDTDADPVPVVLSGIGVCTNLLSGPPRPHFDDAVRRPAAIADDKVVPQALPTFLVAVVRVKTGCTATLGSRVM